MINLFTIDRQLFKRIVYVMVAALFFVSSLPLLQPKASAAQLSSRFIQLSDAGVSGGSITTGVGSGSSVTYQVGFTGTFSTGGGANSLVIDFCTENPIIEDTCTAPTGMNAASAALGTTITGSISTANGYSVSTASASQIRITDDVTDTPFAAAAQRFNITGITNPITVGSFYARIVTFDNNATGTYNNPADAGNFEDYGGIALSTTRAITITARVQEQLTFCLTAADQSTWDAADCTATQVTGQPPAITLGHGSPTPILDSTAVDTASVYSQLSTNATSGAVINLRSNRNANGCTGVNGGGLSADNGQTCAIPPVNAGSGAGAAAMTAGTAAFGLFVNTSTLGTNGVGSLTPSADYYDASHTTIPADLWYGMDSTTAAADGTAPASNVGNVTTTFGDIIASTGSPTYRVNTQYVFAATASLTTPAGIYSANLSMIATGTF